MKQLSAKDLYNLGLAYKMFIKDIEKTAEALFNMYNDGVLQKGGLHIKRYLLRTGIFDASLVESMAEEIEKGNYKVLDKKTFEMLVNTVKNTLIENIKQTIPSEIFSDVNFLRGFNGKE